jgi:hypothetical protein
VRFLLAGLLVACSRRAPAPPACPPPEVIAAIHASAFYFDRGELDLASEQLDAAHAATAGRPIDAVTASLLVELDRTALQIDVESMKAHAEALRARFADWKCLDEATHARLHAALPPVR